MPADQSQIAAFLHAQTAAWNAGDREAFFGAYRAAAPEALLVQYVGRPVEDGWPALEKMWSSQNAAVEVEVVSAIVNGDEAACHHRNRLRAGGAVIDTIELYAFSKGRLAVRYFIDQAPVPHG